MNDDELPCEYMKKIPDCHRYECEHPDNEGLCIKPLHYEDCRIRKLFKEAQFS